MKTQIAWLPALVVLLSGCGGMGNWNYPVVKGSGTVITEARDVAGFDRVDVSGAGNVRVTQGETESLSITTDDNLLPYIVTEVYQNKLRIYLDKVNARPTKGITYDLRVKDLRALNLSGAMKAESGPLETDSLSLTISGSGSISIDHLIAENAELRISGSGSGSMRGEVVTQALHVSGSGSYHAGDLKSQVAEVRISGSGDATVWVSETLDAHISGSGTVSYYGAPRTDQHVSGSGKVRGLGAK